MRYSERSSLFAVLDGEKAERPPCACPLQTGTVDLMRIADAYWPSANNDPCAMARLAKAANVHAGIESVRVPFDVTVDASAFGAVTGMDTVDRQPAVTKVLFPTIEGFLSSDLPDPSTSGRVPVVLDSMKKLVTDPSLKEVPRICGVTGPFMLACQLHGVEISMMDIIRDPGGMKKIVRRSTEWNEMFIEQAVLAGADVIAIVDATASGDLLSAGQYGDFVMEQHRSIANMVDSFGSRSVLHICGDIASSLDMMASCGFDGISVDQTMDIISVKETLKGRAACIGNIGPVSPLLMKGPEDVARDTGEAMAKGVDIIAPGCGLAPRTPLANILAMTVTAKRSDH